MRSFDGGRLSPHEALAGISTVLCFGGAYFILEFYSAVQKELLSAHPRLKLND
jgi:hypothetical protein